MNGQEVASFVNNAAAEFNAAASAAVPSKNSKSSNSCSIT